MYEHNHVRVLLDCARIAQIAQHRAVVGAALRRARKLAQRDYGYAQFLRKALYRARDFGDFLLTRAVGTAAARAHQADIVDHNQIETVLNLQSTAARAHLGHSYTAGRVHVQFGVGQRKQRIAQAFQFVIGQRAVTQVLHVDLRFGAHHAQHQLFYGHFQREHSHIHAQRGFTHRRARGYQHHFARMQAGKQVVQIGKTGWYAVD